MRDYADMTDERRAEAGAGLHYQSREWIEIASAGFWDGAWPVIDRHGKLTGAVIDAAEGYLNVDDEVMIPVDEAVAGGWTIDRDEGYAESPAVATVEFATADETIRICGGLDDFAGLEHPAIQEACDAYQQAAVAALEADARAGRLVAEAAQGQRILHSAWAGAHWAYSCGAIGTMANLTEDEKAAVSAADDAGRRAAREVISADDDEALAEAGLVCGKTVEEDASGGQGHCWRTVRGDDLPQSIREEIEAEMIDGGTGSTDDYMASNGCHYRW